MGRAFDIQAWQYYGAELEASSANWMLLTLEHLR